ESRSAGLRCGRDRPREARAVGRSPTRAGNRTRPWIRYSLYEPRVHSQLLLLEEQYNPDRPQPPILVIRSSDGGGGEKRGESRLMPMAQASPPARLERDEMRRSDSEPA